MRKNILFIGVCILFTGLVALTAGAQEEPAMPENFVVFEEMVSPADMPAFYEAQAKVVELWKKHGMDIPVYCYYTDESAYYWVVPIKNFAAIDELFKKSGEVSAKMKEDGFDGTKAFRDLSTVNTSVINWKKDLSYHPEGQTGEQTFKGYDEWTFMYLRQGHEEELTEAFKKMIDFYDSIPESHDWDVYSMTFGYDTPCWIIMRQGESRAAMRKFDEELNKKYREKLNEIWAEIGPHLRKMKKINGWYWRGWSQPWEAGE
ncbi:hypothetical protein [Maribellus mangrovi]|uniref:hypothetical protein n=1 Tax=Maribellus mangrovi TaxID=3133146 RepID=UPI0030ECE90F